MRGNPVAAGQLPIEAILPDLRAVLATGTSAVVHAPPGAGKTTRVPIALLDEPWLAGRRIVMLEPRRLAARAAAGYMARGLREDVGETVGYRVRMDTRVGPRTRVEVVTEGVLTRMLQADPSLDTTGLLVFDEFHERSLHADLGLALALQARSLIRPDLRIVVMSATLDVDAVSALLDDAPIVRSEGRSHDVATHYLPTPLSGFIEPAVATAVRRALESHEGDVLAFLPGGAEIRRTLQLLDSSSLPPRTNVLPLAGDLGREEQDRAIAPSPAGTRKVVLATAIAETSITIEGVRVVVDAGLMRVPRFSPRTGMTRLATVPVSRAAADQRRGRAGRVAPGDCYRLWTEGEHAGLIAHRPPEIMEADLAPLALELAAWGVEDPAELRWIDPPPAAALAQARELLYELDALDSDGRITPHGRTLADLSLHPRLAHMIVRARDIDALGLACDLAALIGDRDILRAHDGRADPDIRLRLPLLRGDRSTRTDHTVDGHTLRRVRDEARHWRTRMRAGTAIHDDDDAGLLLAFAYPDRIAMQRGDRGRFLLRNGRGASMDTHHPMAGEAMIVVADVGGHGRDSSVYLAAPIGRADVERHFAAQMADVRDVSWDDVARNVRAVERRLLGALVLSERPMHDVPPALMTQTLADAVRDRGVGMLRWTEPATRLRERLAFLHHTMPGEWPAVSDEALLDALDKWLIPFIRPDDGARALDRIDLAEALLALAGWDRRPHVDRLAPTHLEVPSGSRIAIDYGDPAAPVLAVRLQEVFGLAETPRIADGRVPLTLHLLSPARRPVQVTRDLASFWAGTYFDVRKDLRGRYPKHYWPEDPMQAEPTRGVRRRG